MPDEFTFVPPHKTSFLYDSLGRPTQVTLPDSTSSFVTYQGSRTTTRTFAIAAGGASETTVGKREEYDALGRLVAVTENVDLNPNDGVQGELTTNYTYDIGGRLASVSMPGAAGTQTRTFSYDKRGLLLQEQHPETGASGNGTTTYSEHDARGLTGKKVIGSAIDLRFDYDSAGRLIQTKDGKQSDRPLQLYSWDCIRFEVTDPCPANGISHRGQLAATGRYNYDSTLGTIVVFQANQYDLINGHLARRDVAVGSGVVGSETRFTGQDFFFTQNHNDLGLPDTVTYPCRSVSGVCLSGDPGRTIQHDYTRGHLNSVGSWASNISYRPNGMIDTVTHGTGSSATHEKWEPDPNGMTRPQRIYSTNAGGTEQWSSGNYEFDGSGNIKKIGNTSYYYDPFGRLNAWSIANPAGPNSGSSTTSREYDAFGNHLYSSESGCGPGPNPVCYTNSVLAREIAGTTNHYADTSYDGAGNVVLDNAQRAYTWDPLGMMTSATVNGRPFRFLYDANNERIAAVERVPVAATQRNRTTFTLRGDGNQLLSTWTDDWTGGTSVFTRKEDTIWRGAQVLARAYGTNTMNYTPDHLGSPRLITDASGAVVDEQNFDPFGGGGLFGSGALQFTGHERDQANIGGGTFNLPDYMHARFYDKAGRFLSVDPVLGDPSQPQSWNRYAYVMNNPVSFIDPTGLSTHTTLDGTVVAVYDDDDLGVYRHKDLSEWNRKSTLPSGGDGVAKMGTTAFWDEFRAHDNKTGAVLDQVAEGARIQFGMSFDGAIGALHNQSLDMTLPTVAKESRTGGLFDIKNNGGLAPFGANTGRRLNGQYATARSAGNFLAGYNASGRVSFETYMKMAGSLHLGKWSTVNAGRVAVFGTAFAPPPWYGEIEYAGRRNLQGYRYGSR